MKNKANDWDREKKIRRVEKGTNKAGKHRKSIYNMLSENDEESDFDSNNGAVGRNYMSNSNYTKQR